MQTGIAIVENSMEVPPQIKNRNVLQSSNHTSGYLLKEYSNTNSGRYMHPNVYSSVIYNSRIMEAAQVFINRLMDKKDVV